MRDLHELQMKIRQAILGDDPAEIIAAILGRDIPGEARLRIYHNHVFRSLTEALKTTFPVVCRLVDERFFNFAAHAFVAAHPPAAPCLSEYGEGFAAFLDGFPPCASVPYVGDLARLEWAVAQALNAPCATPLAPERLANFPVASAPELIFRLDSSLRLVRSDWAIGRIWSAHQGGEPDAELKPDGGQNLRVRRIGDRVALAEVDGPIFAFLACVQRGGTLAEAVGAGLIEDPLFDAMLALKGLIADGLITDFALSRAPRPNQEVSP
jgi:putative DNA-binding protein